MYVEDVTVSRNIEGTVKTIIVTKHSVKASLGITFSDWKEGEVKILEIEYGSPMSKVVEPGMTVLAVNGTKITSHEKFGEIYDPYLGKVEIMVGPKNMEEAVTIIGTLDLKKKDLEDKNEGLEVALKVEKERREKDVASLNWENKGLENQIKVFEVRVKGLQRAVDQARLTQKNKTLETYANLD